MSAAIKYQEFLQSKTIVTEPCGFSVDRQDINANLYEYQKDLVSWGIRRGKAAFFTMTGTGKTAMQCTWADLVASKTGGTVLILAPLAVSKQTVREAGEKFGISVKYVRHGDELQRGVNITNYEMLHHFDNERLDGIVLDESSILRSFAGKTRNAIIDRSRNIPYRLACSATPAPNDFMEIGNHAEFLGVMNYNEMLATFFVHDGGDTSKWRLKGHAEDSFWRWMASWGCFLNMPSDLGYSDEGFILPPLIDHQHVVDSGATEGALFAFEAKGLLERQAARRESLDRRVKKCAEIVFSSLIGSFCAKMAEKQGGAYYDLGPEIQRDAQSEIPTRSRVQGEEIEPVRNGPRIEKEIHEGVCKGESGKIQANSGSAIGVQCEKTREVCTGCGAQGIYQVKSEGISTEQSPCSQGAADKEIQDNASRISIHDGVSEREMCNLRLQHHYGQKLLSGCGPLPCFASCPRSALHALQSGVGTIQGLARSVAESGRVFEKQWVIWCDLNAEQEALTSLFGNLCVSIYGAFSTEKKEQLLDVWLNKEVPILISKPSIIGFGLNLQQCSNTAFVGLSDSFESIFQATKRFHRHGQKNPVHRHLIISEAEGSVLANIQRKEADFVRMIQEMVAHTKSIMQENIKSLARQVDVYNANKTIIVPEWIREERHD